MIASVAFVVAFGLAGASDDVAVTPDALNPNIELRGRSVTDGGHVRQSSAPASPGESRGAETRCGRPDRFEPTWRCGLGGIEATEANGTSDEVSSGRIEEAVRRVELPANDLVVQPPGGTLVNVPAIFHTRAQTFRESVTLLGHSVDIVATPTRFTWHHGDGTSRSTSGAGRPYPAKDVTHTYTHAAASLSARVDTTYTVRFRVDGGAWSDLDGTLTATGPATTLSVEEAAPVLTRP